MNGAATTISSTRIKRFCLNPPIFHPPLLKTSASTFGLSSISIRTHIIVSEGWVSVDVSHRADAVYVCAHCTRLVCSAVPLLCVLPLCCCACQVVPEKPVSVDDVEYTAS